MLSDIDRFIEKALHKKTQKESDLVKAIITWLKENIEERKVIRKIHGSAFQQAGMPDIVMYWIGTSWHFEVKVPGNTATKLQKKTIKDLRHSGNHAWVVYSVDEVIRLMKPHMHAGVSLCYAHNLKCEGVDWTLDI